MIARSPVNTILKSLRALSAFSGASWRLLPERFKSASLRFKIAFFVVILLTCTSLVLCIMTVQIMNSYIWRKSSRGGNPWERVSRPRRDIISSQGCSCPR